MNFWLLLLSSALPVVKVCVLSLVGVALAHLGVLDVQGRQSLSRVVFYVFIPSLTFTKLAASVDLNNMGRWWFLPFNILLSIGIGMVIGWLGARLLKTPKRLRPHVICSVATGNVGNLPLVLVAALCQDVDSPMAKAVPGGRCVELGVAYVVFAMWVAGIFQFSVAYMLLRPPPQDKEDSGLPTVRSGSLTVQARRRSTADGDVVELQPLREQAAAPHSLHAENGRVVSVELGRTSSCVLSLYVPTYDDEESADTGKGPLPMSGIALQSHQHKPEGKRHDWQIAAEHSSGAVRGDEQPVTSGSGGEGGGDQQAEDMDWREAERLNRQRRALQVSTRDSSSSLTEDMSGRSLRSGRHESSGCAAVYEEDGSGFQIRHGAAVAGSCGMHQSQLNGQHGGKAGSVGGNGPAGLSDTDQGEGRRSQEDAKGMLGGRHAGYAPLRISEAKDDPGADRRRSSADAGAGPHPSGRLSQLAALPWAQMINLPVLSAFAGLAVGCTPPLKGLLFGPEAPLGFLRDCLEVLAAPMIPCMMMVLGAVLYKGPGSANVPARLIAGVSFVRLLLIPLLGTLALLGLRRGGLLRPPDSMFMLVLLLGHSTPTAINVQTLATLHQNGEAEVSCLLFWQYMGAIFTLPLLLSVFFHVI